MTSRSRDTRWVRTIGSMRWKPNQAAGEDWANPDARYGEARSRRKTESVRVPGFFRFFRRINGCLSPYMVDFNFFEKRPGETCIAPYLNKPIIDKNIAE